MIITYKGWEADSPTGERTGEETFTKTLYGREALTSLEAIRMYVNLELISVQRGDRECIRCHCDISDDMGVYVFVDGHCAPDRTTVRGSESPQVLLCVNCGSNGHNGLSRAEFDALMAFYAPYVPPYVQPAECDHQGGPDVHCSQCCDCAECGAERASG
jgi:hypothetical protein